MHVCIAYSIVLCDARCDKGGAQTLLIVLGDCFHLYTTFRYEGCGAID